MSSKLTRSVNGRALNAALVVFALVALPDRLAAQLSLNQPDVFLKANVTARRSTVLRITNQANAATEATIQVQDWHRDENGRSAFLPLGTGPGSCRESLKITPAQVRIEPHETEHVRVSYDGEYDRSCWAVVFVQPSESAAQRGPRTAASGVKVYVQPEWARREGAVQSFTLLPAAGGASSFDVVFRNVGDAHLDAFGAIEIRNAANLVVATLEISRFPVAPTDQRRIRVELPQLAPGRYTAVALFDYAGRDVAERELPFQIR